MPNGQIPCNGLTLTKLRFLDVMSNSQDVLQEIEKIECNNQGRQTNQLLWTGPGSSVPKTTVMSQQKLIQRLALMMCLMETVTRMVMFQITRLWQHLSVMICRWANSAIHPTAMMSLCLQIQNICVLQRIHNRLQSWRVPWGGSDPVNPRCLGHK